MSTVKIEKDYTAVNEMLAANSMLTENALHGYLAANDKKLQVLLDAQR